MDRVTLMRTLALMIPAVCAAFLIGLTRPTGRLAGALILSFLWNLVMLFVLHILAVRLGWWNFEAAGGLFYGFPADLWLGWALLWGPIGALAARNISVAGSAVILLLLDLIWMPRMEPLVRLGDVWLIGECLAVLLGLVPGLLLARWTERGEFLAGRVLLQVTLFSGLFMFLLPCAAGLPEGFGPERVSLGRSVLLQFMIIPAVWGLMAVQEFAIRGRGTPFPYDPPSRLVISGPYAYVRNPMQLCTVLLFLGGALLLCSWWLLAAAVVALAYCEGLARWHEDMQMTSRFGREWLRYRVSVPRWIPRWRPWLRRPCIVYIAQSCGVCQTLERWICDRSPLKLRIVPAELHPTRDLVRVTYVASDGSEDEGISALGRVLEHVTLPWALAGCFLRFPLWSAGIQLLSDAVVAPGEVCGDGARRHGEQAEETSGISNPHS